MSIAQDVDHFLVTDSKWAAGVRGAGTRAAPEQLLVHEHEEGLEIALYLDDGVLEDLKANDPTRCLDERNLIQFWTALEGVSHFLYLIWNAHHGRSISLFELELQAEVDKFVAAIFLLGRQRGRCVPRRLHERLFANPVFDAALDGGEARRYHRANHYARLYCEGLRREYLMRRSGSLLKEVRRFYRLTHRYKLDHIRTRADGR